MELKEFELSKIQEEIMNIYQQFQELNDSLNFDTSLMREKLDKLLVPSSKEKKEFSEVSTPFSLVENMLSSIPSTFWNCSERKVFEPCCGKGAFVISLFDRFFKGLEKPIPDKFERSKKIIGSIIHFADISEINVLITRELLYAHAFFRSGIIFNSDSVICSYYIGDTITNYNDKWCYWEFDAVVGNPPFNEPNNPRKILWNKFVINALTSWIKEEGYLLFVHPPLWRKPLSDIFNLMTQKNNMQHLSIHSKKEGWKLFGCGTRFDWYLIQRLDSPILKTTIRFEDGIELKLDLDSINWIPSKNFELIKSLIAYEMEEKCPIIYSRTAYGTDKDWMSPERNEETGFIYPCIHSTLKGGIIRYYYSRVCNRGHFCIPKVIFGESGIFEPVLDISGEYGLTHCAMAISVSGLEEGELVVSALKSEKFKKIIQSCCFSSFRIDWRIFLDFKRDFYLACNSDNCFVNDSTLSDNS
jgi:hypothetical protein